MSEKKRSFSKEEKRSILKEALEKGVNLPIDKRGLFPATFYSWKKNFEKMGEEGFRHSISPVHLKEIRKIQQQGNPLVTGFHSSYN